MRLTGQLIVEHATLTKAGGPQDLPGGGGRHHRADGPADAQELSLVALPYERIAQVCYLKGPPPHRQAAQQHRPGRPVHGRRAPAQPREREWLAKAKAGVTDPQLEEFRYAESCVSAFAQELKTPCRCVGGVCRRSGTAGSR